MDWALLGFVKASRHRTRIIIVIGKEKAIMPKELVTVLSLHSSQVSRLLRELSDHGVIACLNPQYRRGRLYSLTKRGEEIHSFLLTKS